MARSLRGRGRNGNAEGAGERRPRGADGRAAGGDDERQVLANSKARQDTIRMAVRELSSMKAQVKALNAEIREFKATHIKGDLGFKLADWALIERVYELETEDRDTLLDTVREGFAALNIGQSVDWVAAAEANSDRQPAEPHAEARAQGREDGLAGHRDHAARWPAGEYGHADYALGHADGEAERARVMALGEAQQGGDAGHEGGNGAEPPKRRRGRPRVQAEAGHEDLPPAA